MITKELLSAVFDKPVTLLRVENGNEYYATVVHTEHGTINIYELANKCKEWAFIQGYALNSNFRGYCDICDTGFLEGFEAETEPEAIFKACEWILEIKE